VSKYFEDLFDGKVENANTYIEVESYVGSSESEYLDCKIVGKVFDYSIDYRVTTTVEYYKTTTWNEEAYIYVSNEVEISSIVATDEGGIEDIVTLSKDELESIEDKIVNS